MTRSRIPVLIVVLMLVITGWILYRQVIVWGRGDPIEISIIYSPEGDPFLPQVIEQFNASFAEGINPLTGEYLAQNEHPIRVTGQSGSSGVVQQGIANAIIAPNNSNVARPTIFSPSTSLWLGLVNQTVGREIFSPAASPPTGYGAVVIAIWESRLKAIQEKTGKTAIGWEELLAVMQAPNGWQDYGLPGRKQVYYGHTNPYVSSTGLATLLAEFTASARYNAHLAPGAALTLATINDPKVQEGVHALEKMVKHYAERTTEMRDDIAKGPDYVDFIALQEDALIYINQGQAGFRPSEKLVAVYPKEGTFWFDHPFAIPNADWVSSEQRTAAQLFTDYVLSEPVQKMVLELGLMRPVNPAVALGAPYVSALGVDPNQTPDPNQVAPDPAVIAAAQASWQLVKKHADILLLFDTSGSMEGDKLEKAKAAALLFVEKLKELSPRNRIGIASFNDGAQLVSTYTKIEGTAERSAVQNAIKGLTPQGGTALYDGLLQASNTALQSADGESIRAIILLSDGQDTASTATLQQVLSLDRGENNPLLIFPVAYGSDADIGVLNNIARISATRVLSGEPEKIGELFALLSGFF